MIYLIGLTICNREDSDSNKIRFRRLGIPFKTAYELEKFRISRERVFDKSVYTVHTFTKKAHLYINRTEMSRKERLKKYGDPLATRNAWDYIGRHSKTDLSEILGITRKTLDVRLENDNWKKKEIGIINRL